LEAAEASSALAERSNGPIRFSPQHHDRHDELHSRARAAQELTIGRKLRELRDERHLTQQQMASKAGVPRTYISRIENSRLLPGPIMLRRIADALEVAILDLLPRNRNGNGHSFSEDDPFWISFAGYFSKLRPQEMSTVLEHVRKMLAGDKGNHSFLPV
jgi:transcriptional regulator with XRE-family HTH domain